MTLTNPNTLQPETISGSSLEIERGFLNPDACQALEEECAKYLRSDSVETWEQPADWNAVQKKHFMAAELRALNYPATNHVLDKLGVDDSFHVTVNYQPPHSAQRFHRDRYMAKPVWIMQISEDGFFDHAPNAASAAEAEQTAQEIPVGAGDLVAQYQAWELHRGRNPSDHGRYNLVIFRPKADFE